MKNPFLNKLFLFLPKSLGRKTFSQDSRSAYKSMRICTSKMLVGIAIVFCSWGLPQFVFAQTQYFSFTANLNPLLPTPGSSHPDYNSGYFSGIFTGEYDGTQYNFTALTGSYDGSTLTDIQSTQPSPGPYYLGHASFSSGNAVLNDLHFSFNNAAGLTGGPYKMALLPSYEPALCNSSSTPCTWSTAVDGYPSAGGSVASFTFTAGAPEIDGSLAPKVGFLLGCLFLMFGRKKQNTEALMTA